MAGFQIGDLLAKIGFDTSDVKTAIAQVKADVNRLKSDMERTLARIASPGAFKGLNQAVQGIASGTKAASSNLKNFAAQAKQSTASVAASLAGTGRAFKSLASERTLAGLSDQFLEARVGLRSLARAAEGARLGLLNKQENERIAASIGTGLRAAVDNIGSGFLKLGNAAVSGLGLLKTAALAPINAFKSLLSSVLSIKTALAGFGVFKLFERAGEVDNLRNAFDNLAQSIGAVSGTFLRKLQVATRGTVSELELLRLTNNAILLGVAKTSDQFAELAEAARRLGQATGRTTSQAIEDLALGIGRQSRQLLDNLGIIIKVGEAYTRFAQSVGKSTFELTDAERRTAFFNEAMRKVRERVAALGPDVETVGQAFQRLTATISNIFTDLSRTLVSRNALVSIADFLDRNRPRISAFVTFVRDKVDQIVNALITGFKRLTSGDLDIADFLSATLGLAFRTILRVLEAEITILLPVFLKAGILLGAQLILGLKRATAGKVLSAAVDLRSFFGFGTPAQERVKRAAESFERSAAAFGRIEKGGLIPEAELDAIDAQFKRFQEILSSGLEDSSKVSNDILEQFLAFQVSLEALADSPAVQQSTKDFADSIGTAFSETGKKLGGVFSEFADDLDESIGGLIGNVRKAKQTSAEAAAAFRLALRDPLAGFEPIKTDKFTQPIADAVNKVAELRKRLLLNFNQFIANIGKAPVDRLTALANVAGKKLVEAFEGPIIALSAAPVRLFEGFVEKVAKGVKSLQKSLSPNTLDAEDFNRRFEEFQRRLQDLNFDRLTAGATAGARAVAELNRAFEGAKLDARQIRDVEAMADALRGLASAAEAAQAVAGFREQFENFGLTEGEVIAKRIRKSIAEIEASPAFQLDAVEIQQQIDDIELELAFDPDNPEMKAALDDLNIAFNRAVNAEKSLKDLRDGLKEIEKIEVKIRFASLTKDLTTAIFGGIAEGFERGESAAKIWSNIVSDIFRQSMQRVIDGLTTTIGKAFGELFSGLGLGVGAVDLATGLLGIGSAILVGLRNKQTQTVQDFSQQVNSSEAIRGVVAGPTNVAIAKVGDSLKFALRTVESQLERIAVAVERGSGTGKTATGAPFSTRLTSSTPS